MTKANIAQWDTTAANNTDINDISLAENVMKPPAVNNAFREMMAQVADLYSEDVTFSSGQQEQFRTNIGANLLGGFRNKLINALGTINQRGYSSGAATSGANEYTLDRWRVVTSGQSLSWTESENVRTMTAPAGGVEQVIEGESLLTGSYVLNWEGTATATVDGNARTKGEVFTLTGGTDATVRFIGGTFSKPQLEAGSSPTQFEVRHIGQEGILCKRYYQRLGEGNLSIDWRGYGLASQTVAIPIFFPVPMRAAPTASIVGTWNYVNFASGPAVVAATATCFSLNGQLSGTNQFAFRTNDDSDHIELDAEL